VNPTPQRRELLAQRVAEMRGLIARMDDLDQATVLSNIDPILRQRFATERMLPRLAMRRGRRIAANKLFGAASDNRERALLTGGADQIEELCHSVGAHILWREVVRLVRRVDAEALNADLGIPAREIALTARDEAIEIKPMALSGERVDLAERVRREGAMGWACWLAACKPGSARRLRVLTPDLVSSRVRHRLPEDQEQRNLRRRVVEAEIDRIVARRTVETREKQVL